jgi:hypothetical protein
LLLPVVVVEEGLLTARVGCPEADVTPAVGFAALVGMAEGEGVVEMFFLGAMVDLVVCEVDWEVQISFLALVVVVDGTGSTQWLEVEVRGRSLT